MANVEDVVDQPDQSRFVYVEEGSEAQLVYRSRPGRLILVHTEVPEALGGRGIGGTLVAAAVARAKDTGEEIAPWCPFARRWLEGHAEEATGVAIDWSPAPPLDD